MLVIVTGPPCAGKTTYVSEHAQPGDIIIDFDAMAAAFGAPGRQHEYSAAMRDITQYARGAAIKMAIGWHRRGARVWITECEPPPARWQQYAQAGARHVPLAAGPAEIHRRIDAGRPASYHAIADDMLRRAAATARARQPAESVTTRAWLRKATGAGFTLRERRRDWLRSVARHDARHHGRASL